MGSRERNGQTCMAAAKGGHLEVLQWARANGCRWNKTTCAGAAQGGRLEVLHWARANGCPWNFFECLSGATANDKVDVLAWLQEMFVGISDDPALHF